MITSRFYPHVGGVEVAVEGLARGLAELGCQVEVLCQESAGRQTTQEWHGLYRVIRFPALNQSDRFRLSAALGAHLIAHSSRYDLLHTHSYHDSPAVMAAVAARVPVLFTPYYHGTGHTRAARALHLVYGPAAALAFRRVDQLVCVSTAEAERLSRDFPAWRQPQTVIPIGVDLERIMGAEAYPSGVPVVLVVGRLVGYKQVERVLDAMALVERAELIVVGDGEKRSALEDRAQHLGIAGRVRFLGQASDTVVDRWRRTARVLVTMSRHESFGLTALEGAAAGARVVASDIPSHRELTGYSTAIDLVPVDAAADELAGAIEAALADREVPETSSLPTLQSSAKAHIDLYRSVLARRADRRRGTTSPNHRRYPRRRSG